MGTDSAGATVEIEQRGGEFVRARVTDIVLGTGSADILFMNDDEFSFTIDFPAGARITYSGVHGGSVGGSGPESIEGTWTQDAGGLFGDDQGTWKVSG